jgi:SAM-dependent methyltransferase
MPFYRDRVYPYLVSTLGDPDPIREIRRQVIPLAQGEVLEIGVGAGANFVHYDLGKVQKLYALEPNPGMIRLAQRRRRRTGLEIEFLDLPGERIPLMEGTIDTIVSTFTLCSIANIVEAIRDMRRVIRPGGKLIFFELTCSPDPAVRRWQRWWEPLQQRVYTGLFLTRDIPVLLIESGFQIEHVDTAYLSCFPKAWTHCCWGTATLQSAER